MEGWLDKQSGGKLQKKGLGNTMAKWDRRFFVLKAGTSTLQYFKSERDASVGKKPAGELNCDGGEVKRETAGGNVFSISTAERVLTLRAESQQDVTDWTLAVVAAGGHTELGAFSAAGSQRDMTMSQVAAAEASKASPRGAPLSAAARDVASPAARSESPAVPPRVGDGGRAVSADDVALPGMEGYLTKQSGGKTTGKSTAGEMMRKWDRRYFKMAAGSSQLAYYKSKEECAAGKPPAGKLDVAGATLKVEEEAGGLYVMHLVTPTRTLSIRADAILPLESWVGALKAPGRVAAVERTEKNRRTSGGGAALSPAVGAGAAAAGADAQRRILDRYKPIKVLLLGDAGVGKTCVLQRFADGTFVSSTRATVGMDLKRTTIDLDGTGEKVTLQIWDTAGQEMFRSIIASYYRGAHGVVLMYDVTRASSFDALHGWLAEVRAKCADDVVAVLVGNKVDCGTEGRQVDQAAAAAFAAEHGMPYVEVSAKAGVMVNEAFITLVATIAGRADELPTLIKRAKLAGPGSAAKADEARAEQNGTVSLTPQAPAPARKGAPQAGCAC